ncbi:hypothetical protein V8C42DRAFT_331890 [Trichoderma barbatum]
MTTSRYTLETAPLDCSNASGVKPKPRNSRAATSEKRPRRRPSKERRTERKTKSRKLGEHTISLTKALSQIAKEMNPHKDLSDGARAFAYRTVHERRQEAQTAGKIKRPLNAFMLYRRTFQDVAKSYCTRNNHQQVSTVCGESWTTCEPADITALYNDLATAERQMHETAFPNYKYDPSYSKKEDVKDQASSLPANVTGLELVHGRSLTRGGRVKRNKKKAPKYIDFQHLGNEVYLQAIGEQPPLPATAITSLPYWTSPAAQTYPSPYPEEQHAYIDSSAYQTHCVTTADDNCSADRCSPPVIHGLYGDTVDAHINYTEICIDPSLLPCQPNMVYDISNCSVAIQGHWQPVSIERPRTEAIMPSMDMGGSYDAYLRGTDQDWQVEPLDEPSQFDDWMAQTDA